MIEQSPILSIPDLDSILTFHGRRTSVSIAVENIILNRLLKPLTGNAKELDFQLS